MTELGEHTDDGFMRRGGYPIAGDDEFTFFFMDLFGLMPI